MDVISAISPLPCSTTSQPAASARAARLGTAPDSAFIEISSLTSTPSNPIRPRNVPAMTAADRVAGFPASRA